MRYVIAIVLLLTTVPALAQFWTHNVNERFGYELDIPPGFTSHGGPADESAQHFFMAGERQELKVWGGRLESGLEDFTASLIVENTANGWNTTSQAATPQWASLSGVQPRRSFFQRMILLCDGEGYASFRLEFDTADLNAIEPVLQGLTRSFVPMGC